MLMIMMVVLMMIMMISADQLVVEITLEYLLLMWGHLWVLEAVRGMTHHQVQDLIHGEHDQGSEGQQINQ